MTRTLVSTLSQTQPQDIAQSRGTWASVRDSVRSVQRPVRIREGAGRRRK